jgi:hypothetical protein
MVHSRFTRPATSRKSPRWNISLRACFILLTVVACALGIGCFYERAVLGEATGSFLLVIVVPAFYGVVAYKVAGKWTACAAAIFGFILAFVLYTDFIALRRIERSRESTAEATLQQLSR